MLWGREPGIVTPRCKFCRFGYPMTIFERYVFRQAGGALLIILLSLSGIVWIALALRQLNVVTSQGQDVWMLVKMTTLALPNLMAIIAPFSLLIAAIHTLNRLNSDSELIVLTASGATVWSGGAAADRALDARGAGRRLRQSPRDALEHAAPARLHRAGAHRHPYAGHSARAVLEP